MHRFPLNFQAVMMSKYNFIFRIRLIAKNVKEFKNRIKIILSMSPHIIPPVSISNVSQIQFKESYYVKLLYVTQYEECNRHEASKK